MGKIVWLASYPKSGNTWLRAFLHNYITESKEPHDINALTDFSVSESAAAFYKKYDSRAPRDYTELDVQRMRPKVHRDLTGLHDDLVFVKTHNAMLALHNTPLCTPQVTGGAVYVVRDPRDIAVSYARYTGRSTGDIISFMGKTKAANRGNDIQVFEFLSSWSRHVESWTQSKFHFVARYEDMLEKPVEIFGRIIQFLGGEPEPERLRQAIAFSNFETLSKQEAVHGYVAKAAESTAPFFRQGGAGQWQKVLKFEEIKQLESDHGPMMRRFGYL